MEKLNEEFEYIKAILSVPIESDSDESILKTHLTSILNIQVRCVEAYHQSKRLYLTDKKNIDYQILHSLGEQLNKELHYRLTALQSLLKSETQIANMTRYGK